MRERLVLRLMPDSPDDAEWLVVDSTGRPVGVPERTHLDEVAARASGREVVLIVPGEEVLLCQAHIPSRNRRRILQALPYALEDQLAEDIATLHFAIAPRQNDDMIPAAVISRAVLEPMIERLQDHGMRADIAVPATLALPYEDGTWALLVEGDRALLRTGRYRGLTTDCANLPAVMRLAAGEAGEVRPAKIRLWRIVGPRQPRIKLETSVVPVEESALPESLTLHAQAVGDSAAIDLLQGDYSRREQLGRLWRPWRAAAALLGAWIVTQALVTGIDLHHLSRERAALGSQIQTIYRDAFPGARNVVLPRVQMEQQLKKLRASAGGGDAEAFALLAGIADALHAVPGVSLQALSYHDNRLDIDLQVKELQQLDRIKERALRSPGISVEIVSASARDGKVAGRLRIERKS